MPTEILASPQKKSRRRKIYYPEGDGRPMAETDPHVRQIIKALLILEYGLHNYKEVYLGANMFLYYQNVKSQRKPAKGL